MSLETGCACVHACAWTKLNAQEMHGNEVRGILQKKFRSQSFSGVEESYTRQRPFTPLWRVRADAVVVKSAVPNPPQTSKRPNALVSELKGGSAVLKELRVPAFITGVLNGMGRKEKAKMTQLQMFPTFTFFQQIFSPCYFLNDKKPSV